MRRAALRSFYITYFAVFKVLIQVRRLCRMGKMHDRHEKRVSQMKRTSGTRTQGVYADSSLLTVKNSTKDEIKENSTNTIGRNDVCGPERVMYIRRDRKG